MTTRIRPVYVLVILFLINTLNFFDRQIIAAVNEPIRKEWSLSDTDMGLMGTAFILLYAVVGVPLGRWADRGSRPLILGLGAAVWSIFTGLSGVAWNYWSLFVARLGVGVGEASCSPAGNSLIGDLFPASKRARAIAIFMLGLPIGITLSFYLSGIVAKAYGWRAAFLLALLPGLVLAALAFKIREPERGAAEEHKAVAHEGHSFWWPYLRVLGVPTMWWISLSGALHNFNAYAVNQFMAAYLGRYHGMSLRQATTIAAFTLGAVGIVGLLGGGLVADWARRWRPNGRLLVGALALFISTPCVYFALDRPAGAMVGFVVLMSVGWMLMYVYYVTVYPAIQDVIEPQLRGTAMALYFFAMYVIGGAFGTVVLGAVSDAMARRAMAAAGASAMTEAFKAAGLHSAFYIVPVVSLALTLVLFAASRTVGKDMARMQAWLRGQTAKAAANKN